jgi:hypothetical protein
MLAPLTNTQSHADGRLSEDEFRWLTMRAQGGFGLTMTCAAHVQRQGQGFPGQLGVWDDMHIDGLSRLATAIKAQGSHSIVQLHHAGMRSPKDLIGEAPLCPSDNAETGARGLSLDEVRRLRDDFIAAARRAERLRRGRAAWRARLYPLRVLQPGDQQARGRVWRLGREPLAHPVRDHRRHPLDVRRQFQPRRTPVARALRAEAD